MLTEEAHHMFVGETGIARILERTCQLMKEAGFSGDVRKIGGIDIPTIQKHLNQWFSLSLDLHGGEVSSNAASYFANGLKGRAKEDTYDGPCRQERVLQHGVLRAGAAGDQGRAAAQRDERGAARLVRRRLRRGGLAAGTGSSRRTGCRID
jgi:benzoyl-CoA 2,3-dioxygenase component B